MFYALFQFLVTDNFLNEDVKPLCLKSHHGVNNPYSAELSFVDFFDRPFFAMPLFLSIFRDVRSFLFEIVRLTLSQIKK
jgi:hypothetical protein